MQVKTILVPSDFSSHAAKALETAVELAKVFEAKIVIVHAYLVQPPPSVSMQGGYVIPEGYFEQARDHAHQQVELLASQQKGSGVEVEGKAVEAAASQAILEAAEEIAPDLIVMGTRGQTGLKHVLLGSVAERIVRLADCPVLTVKADA